MDQIKAFVFDAYGTLFDVRSVMDRCEATFPGNGPALTTLWRAKQLEYSWLRALMGRYEDFWQVTKEGLEFACRSLGLSYAPEQIDHLMQGYLALRPFPETAAVLDTLGVPCAILSNGTPSMLQEVVRHAGLEGRFKHVLSVDMVKTYKPSPAVYELAVKCFGVEPHEIGFVSSNGWDVAGAKAFGFIAYWINRRQAPAELLGVKPDKILSTATELVALR